MQEGIRSQMTNHGTGLSGLGGIQHQRNRIRLRKPNLVVTSVCLSVFVCVYVCVGVVYIHVFVYVHV